MKTFSEALRYDYPLNGNSVVIDGGGYEGNWAYEIDKKYHCRVHVFEPVFFEQIKSSGNIIVIPCGIGAYSRLETFHIQNNSTGRFGVSDTTRQVVIMGIVEIGRLINSFQIDLLKLNIEGMEYEVLEAMIANDMVKRCVDIQVQFHRIPGAEQRLAAIRNELSKTHEQSYCVDWCWEGWTLKHENH